MVKYPSFNKEIETMRREYKNRLMDHAGKYVVIDGNKIVAIEPTFQDAAKVLGWPEYRKKKKLFIDRIPEDINKWSETFELPSPLIENE